MALNLVPPLLITFDNIRDRAFYLRNRLDSLTEDEKNSVLQFVHDWLFISSDQDTPGDSQLGLTMGDIRILQTNLGAWYVAFSFDNPAGTGSLSSVSINSFSVTNTLAKNNAQARDLLNANQYGTQAYEILTWRHQTVMMI